MFTHQFAYQFILETTEIMTKTLLKPQHKFQIMTGNEACWGLYRPIHLHYNSHFGESKPNLPFGVWHYFCCHCMHSFWSARVCHFNILKCQISPSSSLWKYLLWLLRHGKYLVHCTAEIDSRCAWWPRLYVLLPFDWTESLNHYIVLQECVLTILSPPHQNGHSGRFWHELGECIA